MKRTNFDNFGLCFFVPCSLGLKLVQYISCLAQNQENIRDCILVADVVRFLQREQGRGGVQLEIGSISQNYLLGGGVLIRREIWNKDKWLNYQ